MQPPNGQGEVGGSLYGVLSGQLRFILRWLRYCDQMALADDFSAGEAGPRSAPVEPKPAFNNRHRLTSQQDSITALLALQVAAASREGLMKVDSRSAQLG